MSTRPSCALVGRTEREVHRIRLYQEPLGDVDLDRWSGVILGGGPYNVSDPPADKSADQRRAETDVLRLLDDVVARDFPFLGCCHGIGALGAYIGATIDRRFAEPIGPSRYRSLPLDAPIRCSPTFRTDSRPSSDTRKRSASFRRAPYC